MLNKITIQNFKGIETCEVKDLRRINLFIGKNDSGKSTILEAAYYLFREMSSPQLQGIMSRRTNVSSVGSELWFKYKTNYPIVISVLADGLRLAWEIRWDKETDTVFSIITSQTGRKKQAKKVVLRSTQYRGISFSSSVVTGDIVSSLLMREKPKRKFLQYASNMSLIDCTLKSRTTDIERILGELKIGGKDVRFGKILNDAYGKGKEWEFIPQPENPNEKRLAIREAGRLTYLSDFGDGLRCCVGILGTAMSTENTAIFIEEIESHQHTGSLNRLIRHLVEIARENNLQIFLSTHSDDVWNSFARGVYKDDIERETKEFRCFVTERDSESGKVTVEKTEDVQKITHALGRP